jgi:hypothetical protein
MAFLRVFQVRGIKQGRGLDRAFVAGLSEDTESFPRRPPRDYPNEPGKVVFAASLGGGPFFALQGLLPGEAAPPFRVIAPALVKLR